MKKYKSIYLVRSANTEDSPLVEVQGKEWFELKKANRADTEAPRRYFICDTIIENETVDRLFIEVSESEYRQWRVKQQATRRWLESVKGIKILSLDAQTENEDVEFEDTIPADNDMEDLCVAKALIQDLRSELTKWRPWAGELLDMYLMGKQRSSTAWLAKQCGVSAQMARRYRKDFEEFTKAFLT